jgi:DNA-binding CsgD family transcriptional regulator
MSTAFDLEKIQVSFTDAAIDSSLWDQAMDVVAKVTGGCGALLFPIKGRLPMIPCSRSMRASLEIYIRDGWIHRDERYRGVHVMLQRGVTTDFDFASPTEISRHPYYQEFLAPFGLRWFAGVKVAAGDDVWCLSIQKSIKQGPFTCAEVEQLASLSRQLGFAAALAQAFGFARAEAALDAFNVSGSPVALLDRCGEVLRLNHTAEQLLGRDLRVSCRRIVSMDRNATVTLDAALQKLLWACSSSALMPPVLLPRTEGHPLIAYPMRLSRVSAGALSPCQAILMIVDPDARSRPPEAVLRSCFGLTSAEAKLAKAMATGDMLETVSGELGISYETARNQLKAVFAKTSTHRQAELVTLFARLLNGCEVL